MLTSTLAAVAPIPPLPLGKIDNLSFERTSVRRTLELKVIYQNTGSHEDQRLQICRYPQAQKRNKFSNESPTSYLLTQINALDSQTAKTAINKCELERRITKCRGKYSRCEL